MAEIDRRRFLGASAAFVTSVAGLTRCEPGEEVARPAVVPTAQLGRWETVRSLFALDPSYVHLAAPVLASHPRTVREAIRTYRDGLDENTKPYLYGNQGELEGAVISTAASYLGVSRDEIALTDSTTMGLGLLYGGLSLKPGQEILTTEHDFYATHEALRLRSDEAGASVRKVPLYRDLSRVGVDEILATIRSAITGRTRVLALTWVHSSTGLKLPIPAIADVVAEANRHRDDADRLLLCVDGVHGLGVEPPSLDALGCDFFVAGTHKWLFGPRGTGIVWGRRDAWTHVRPVIPSFAGEAYAAWLEGRPPRVEPGPWMTPGGFHSFEHRWALAEAFRLHAAIGPSRIEERVRQLAGVLKSGLSEIAGVEVITPMDPELSAGIVCAAIGSQDPHAVVSRLERDFRVVASTTPYREVFVRFMPSIVNAEDEIDQVLRAVRSFV